MYNARLTGAGHVLPERIVTCEELETIMEFDKFGIRKGMAKLLSGVAERRFASDDQNSSDMAVAAGKMAIEKAGLNPEDIDLLIFAAISQDFTEPATANVVQTKLRAVNARCFDVKNACNAFLQSVEIANMYIRNGKAKNVLIASGEVLTRFIRTRFESKEQIDNSNSTFSVGDGGGAVVLQAYECDESDVGIQTRFETHGEYWMDGVLWGGGTMYPHDPDKLYFQNESREVMKLNFERAMKYYNESFEMFNIKKEDVSLFIPSQITKYLIVKTCDILEIPQEKVVCQVTKLGNTGASAIPIGISRAICDGTLKLGSGQTIVCMGAANGFNLGIVSMQI